MSKMVEETRVFLCFHVSDESQIAVALDYWEGGLRSGWKTSVKQISARAGVPKHRLPELARQFATAYDVDTRCDSCGSPRQLLSRSDSALWPHTWKYTCDLCRAAEAESQREEKEQAERSEGERLGNIIQGLIEEEQPFNYEEIDYLDAIVAYAIMLSSQSATADGRVGNPFELTICSSNSLLAQLLGRLFKHGVLVFHENTPIDALDPESRNSGSFRFFPLKVVWQFAVPVGNESFSSVFRQLSSIIELKSSHPSYWQSVSDLWWMLSRDDVQSYLEEQLASYRLYGLSVGEKMQEAMFHALSRFSIPRVRYLLYRIAKNVAALSSHRDFTRQHALNTVPGSLIRDCDRAIADQWSIKPYCKKWDEEEVLLITLLFDRVLGSGIDGFKEMTGDTLRELSLNSVLAG
jgi:hypothetical protein